MNYWFIKTKIKKRASAKLAKDAKIIKEDRAGAKLAWRPISRLILENITSWKGWNFSDLFFSTYQFEYDKNEFEVKFGPTNHYKSLESSKIHEIIEILTSGDLSWPQPTVTNISCEWTADKLSNKL